MSSRINNQVGPTSPNFELKYSFNSKLMYFYMLESLTADPLGRFDANALSDQQMMELLVQDMPHGRLQDDNGDFHDIAKWFRVKLHPDGDVDRFWFVSVKSGSFSFAHLPRQMTEFKVINTGLTATLDTRDLPQSLRLLHLVKSPINGEVDWEGLPPGLISLALISGQFHGTVNLEILPTQLEVLCAHRNQFCGSVSLTALPAVLRNLDLAENCLEGTLDLEHLPAKLERLSLSKNNFSGGIVLNKLPKSLKQVYLGENALRGDIIIENLPKRLEELKLEANRFDGKFEVRELWRTRIDIRDNLLRVCIIMHRDMKIFVDLRGNQIEEVVEV